MWMTVSKNCWRSEKSCTYIIFVKTTQIFWQSAIFSDDQQFFTDGQQFFLMRRKPCQRVLIDQFSYISCNTHNWENDCRVRDPTVTNLMAERAWAAPSSRFVFGQQISLVSRFAICQQILSADFYSQQFWFLSQDRLMFRLMASCHWLFDDVFE